jgi:hypothetical protein
MPESVYILFRQPDYDRFFEDPDYDGSPVDDEGEERQLGVYATRERAEAEKLIRESGRAIDEAMVYRIDEYRLGELHWLSGFFVSED